MDKHLAYPPMAAPWAALAEAPMAARGVPVPAGPRLFAVRAVAVALIVFSATYYANSAGDERLMAIAHALLGAAVVAFVALGRGSQRAQRGLMLAIVAGVWASYAAMRLWKARRTVADALTQCGELYDTALCAQLRQTWEKLAPQIGGVASGCPPLSPHVAQLALAATVVAGLGFFSSSADAPSLAAAAAAARPQWGTMLALGGLAAWVGWMRWTHLQLDENPIVQMAQNEYLQAPLQRIAARVVRHRTYTIGGALLLVYLLVHAHHGGGGEAAIAAVFLLLGVPMLQNLRNLCMTLEQWTPITRGIPSLHYDGKTRPAVLREGVIALSVAVALACAAQLARAPNPSWGGAAALAALFVGLVFLYDVPGMLRYHIPADMPPGSWRLTARYPVMRNGQLHAQLQNTQRQWVGAAIALPPPGRSLRNINGVFRVEPEDHKK